MPYTDGTYTSAVQNGPKRVFYPFLNSPTKDTTTKGTVRNYVVLPANFSPASALSTDPDDATQYLIEESELAVDNGVGRFSRTYCKVPGDQVTYGTRVITKPSASSVGGTELLYAATKADFDANIISGLAYSYAGYFFAPTEIFGAYRTCTSVTSGANRRITLTAHGVTSQPIMLRANASFFVLRLTSSDYTVVDANTIDILSSNTDWTTLAVYKRDYTPGTDRVRIRETQKFYLPTVTVGITTPTDIPIPDLLLNDTQLLTAVLTYTSGFQTYDASELEQWLKSPIYTQTLIDIDMATL